jgi:hypothetical protein
MTSGKMDDKRLLIMVEWVVITAWGTVGLIEIFHGFLQFLQAATGIYRPTTAFPIRSDRLLDYTTVLYYIRGVAKLTEC